MLAGKAGEAAYLSNGEARKAHYVIEGVLKGLVDDLAAQAKATNDSGEATVANVRAVLMGVVAASMLLAIALGLLVTRIVSRQLGGPQSLLHTDKMGCHPARDFARVSRAPIPLGGQAASDQAGQLGVGRAGIEPAQGVGQVAPPSLGADLFPGRSREGGAAGQDLAQDRTQPEHVGSFVNPL